MLLHVREAEHGLWTGAVTTEIARTSRMVSRMTGYQVQPNKAIVGPQRVPARVRHPPGRRPEGAHHLRDHGRRRRSGSSRTTSCSASTPAAHALRKALEEMGYKVDGHALNTAFKRFKEVADRKKTVTALDLEALVSDEMRQAEAAYTLESFDIEAGSGRRAVRRGQGAAAEWRDRRRQLHRRRPGERVLQRAQRRDGARGAAQGVPRARRHGGPRRARRGDGAARARGPRRPRARACRRTRWRPRAAPTCARSRTRSRTPRSPRPSTTSTRQRAPARPRRWRARRRSPSATVSG